MSNSVSHYTVEFLPQFNALNRYEPTEKPMWNHLSVLKNFHFTDHGSERQTLHAAKRFARDLVEGRPEGRVFIVTHIITSNRFVCTRRIVREVKK